jgi:SAM-dependent methyltransferase
MERPLCVNICIVCTLRLRARLSCQLTILVLQVGCGVGNTVFPLLEVNPDAYVYACDFASTAVGHVREHPNFQCGRIEAFEADITRDDLLEKVPMGKLDFVTMVFVLSALDPSAMHQVSPPLPCNTLPKSLHRRCQAHSVITDQ